jgi:hypothetical protein
MQLATVPLKALTERVCRRMGRRYDPATISQARSQGIGHAGLLLAVREETAAMLQEAADEAKANAQAGN